MITTQDIYTAATAAMFLAAGFLVVNVLIASGRVLRGKDQVSELPTRLIGVGIALMLTLTAWPYLRTAILNTIGQDAPGMVETINSLSNLSDKAGNVTTVGTEGLGEFSSQTWGNVGTAIRNVLSAPDPTTWDSATQTQSTASEDATVFEPLTVDGQPLVGEMSVNDPNLPPTFPDPTPTTVFQPLVVNGQAVRGQMSVNNTNLPSTFADPTPTPYVATTTYQGVPVTQQLQETVENNSWLKFHTDSNGRPVTGAMSVPVPNTNSAEEAPASNNPFQTLEPSPGGGPTYPSVQPAQSAAHSTTVTTYTVQQGDTMFLIAKARYGDGNQWTKICSANTLPDCNNLRPGTTIVLP